MRPRVLIVEDEPDLRSLVEFNLQNAGYDTSTVASAFEAQRAIDRDPPDLVVLDLMLPDYPGTEVCRELRRNERTRSIPVVMLTAKGEESSRIYGLEVGADDYIVKPVSMKELVLRVGAILRRSAGPRPEEPRAGEAVREQQSVEEAGGEVLRRGGITIDRQAHRVEVAGREVTLTPLEFELLVTLARRAGRVQTRDSLLDTVWGGEREIAARTVDMRIKRLRSKLGEEGARIETVRGVGYRLRRDEPR